jgi:hypothetical protein
VVVERWSSAVLLLSREDCLWTRHRCHLVANGDDGGEVALDDGEWGYHALECHDERAYHKPICFPALFLSDHEAARTYEYMVRHLS